MAVARFRKLQSSVGLDVLDRTKKLLDFYGKVGLDDEAEWHKKRIEWIERGGTEKSTRLCGPILKLE